MIMRIAIYNRKETNLVKLKQAIYCYSSLRQIELVIDCYSQSDKLLRYSPQYNLIFFFRSDNSKNEFEVISALRECNNRVAIIFIGPNIKCVSEAFKVNAFRFLTYPVTHSDLLCALDEYFKSEGNNFPIWIKSGTDTLCLNTSEIFYLEANNKNCYIHLEDSKVKSNRTMAKVFSVLPQNHFIKINRAYIINTDCIAKYNNESVFLKNGSKLKIGRTYLSDFKIKYQKYESPLIT